MSTGRRLLLGIWSLILPVSFSFVLMFLVWTDSTTMNTLMVVSAGVLAGLIVGYGFGLRDWRILIPPLAAGLIGLGLYPLIESVAWTSEPELRAYALVWLGQSTALYVSIWLNSIKGVARSPSKLDEPQESREGHLV